ncbi:MAG: hypothetical protein JWO86_534 [Myxococcaceae bacterium]|nr:hypothetical protein [Myxococcaceae bacterium]
MQIARPVIAQLPAATHFIDDTSLPKRFMASSGSTQHDSPAAQSAAVPHCCGNFIVKSLPAPMNWPQFGPLTGAHCAELVVYVRAAIDDVPDTVMQHWAMRMSQTVIVDAQAISPGSSMGPGASLLRAPSPDEPSPFALGVLLASPAPTASPSSEAQCASGKSTTSCTTTGTSPAKTPKRKGRRRTGMRVDATTPAYSRSHVRGASVGDGCSYFFAAPLFFTAPLFFVALA